MQDKYPTCFKAYGLGILTLQENQQAIKECTEGSRLLLSMGYLAHSLAL